jgi:hypothetical protein
MLLLSSFALSAAVAPDDISFQSIRDVRDFREATAPAAIQYACSAQLDRLESYFTQRGLPFESRLVRRRQRSKACHILYEPTLPGFRALPDDAPVRRLFGSIDPDGFVVGRKPVGDSLDVIKQVLRVLPRPIDVTLSVTQDLSTIDGPRHLKAHFPETEHRIILRPSAAEDFHPWAQDYVKAGEVEGSVRILAPRRLFEGRSADGERFQPLLSALSLERFVQSKLSWEGGDLQVVVDPRDPSRRILFYGGAVRRYWGKELSADEFGYVLRLELGADTAVDLSETGVHADFAVGFLPREKIAIVAEPRRSDLGVARAAAAALSNLFANRAPPELARLRAALEDCGEDLSAGEDRIRALIASLDEKLPSIAPLVPAEAHRRLETYMAENCPRNIAGCFTGAGKRQLYQTAPELLQTGLNALADAELDAKLPPALLGLIEAQLPGSPDSLTDLLNSKADEIAKLGFRVLRAPYLTAASRPWAGVSYVNFLVFDQLVFAPSLGLGEAEAAIFAKLQADIGPGYQVMPVNARLGLLHNGGVHCVFGIEREPHAGGR